MTERWFGEVDPCSACHGTGQARYGNDPPQTCGACGGKGEVVSRVLMPPELRGAGSREYSARTRIRVVDPYREAADVGVAASSA